MFKRGAPVAAPVQDIGKKGVRIGVVVLLGERRDGKLAGAIKLALTEQLAHPRETAGALTVRRCGRGDFFVLSL